MPQRGGTTKSYLCFHHLTAGDLVIDGSIPAGAVFLVDADTAAFDFPTITPGQRDFTIAQGVIEQDDVGHTPIDAFSQTLTVELPARHS